MNLTALMTSLLSMGLTNRDGQETTGEQLTPWLEKHVPLLKQKFEALGQGGMTWQEVGDLIEAGMQAGQELKPLLFGTTRAAVVTQVLNFVIMTFAPPSLGWLRFVASSGLLSGWLEAAFRRKYGKS